MATTTTGQGARSASDVLSEEVRALMGRRRMSATALAGALGKSQQSVSDRLRGHRNWSLDDLPALAKVFGVDANALLPDLGSRASAAVCAPWDLNPEPAD